MNLPWGIDFCHEIIVLYHGKTFYQDKNIASANLVNIVPLKLNWKQLARTKF
jgi:hypothetical protein